ncbi:MAG: twin-arginine translocase TatA/TatE family subunit [Verrucomicrobiales bacterium]|nr:twin-arginine translocase TatA/TatE family subunit [Verrucomicrobiales bacterium]
MNILALGALGMPEMIAIFLVVLLLFGAKKIPELARGVGKGMGEFKKAKDEFEREIKEGEVEGAREWERKPSSSDSVASSDADHSDPHHGEEDKA